MRALFEAETDRRLQDGFSTIYWRIYTEEQGIANHPQEGPANGYTILRHLGRLKDLEARLRHLNCLASCPRRLGLWVFSSTPNFESLNSLYVKDGDSTTTKILVDTTTLKGVEIAHLHLTWRSSLLTCDTASASGSITSQELTKGLSSETQNNNGPQAAAPQRPQQGQPSSRRPDGHGSSAAIYASFVSAVTGAISLHLIRRYGALPLGSRTLFTAVENLDYENPRVDNKSMLSRSYLTTLNVQLNAPGTLTISPQTISQDGITRLCSPRDDMADVLRVQPGIDLWLCPNGAIARLVTANMESPNAPSPGSLNSANTATRKQQWKLDVRQWLANFGLHIESIDEEPWVEVEVWEPFFARLAGEARRQNDESTQSAIPLKRMLWPARFCFRRCGPSTRFFWPRESRKDPLEFAERWFSKANSLKINHDSQNIPTLDKPQARDHEISSPRVDNVENFESLSRIAQYPELQATNLVYPTPPDGAASIGMSNANTSDAFPEDADFNLSPAAPQDTKNPNPDLTSNTGIGTGHYDASDDEDLFGDMNERDFGSKGITDADFSFFDDPSLERVDGDASMELLQETPHVPLETNNPWGEGMDDKALPVSTAPEAVNATERTEEAPAHQVERIETKPVDVPMDLDGSAQSSPEPQSQPISPPLSPVVIKRILFPGSQEEDHGHARDCHAQQGHYHPVAFEKQIGDWDQKYGTAGKFWFSTWNKSDTSDQSSNAIPTIGLPHRGRNATAGTSHTKLAGKNASPLGFENLHRSSSISSSSSSDDSDYLPLEHVPTPLTFQTLKRKRAPSESDIQSAASPAKSSGGPDGSLGLKSDNSTFLGNFLASFSDWTLTGYFSAFQVQQLPILLRREDQIQVTQLLVDQITQSSLDHLLSGRIGLFGLESELLTLRTSLEDANFLGDVAKLHLKGYTSLQEDTTAVSTQQSTRDSGRSSISRLLAPHLRVCRGNEYLEALPPAVSFWETFGLEPAHGPKDISAYCLYPNVAAKASDAFLDRFGLTYQSCNFGSHVRGDKSMAFDKGLRSWDSEVSTYAAMMQTLKGLCEELGMLALTQAYDFYDIV